MTSAEGESWRRVAERLGIERLRLTKALLIYGQHKSTCMYVVRDGYACTCGFDAALEVKEVQHDK